MRYGTFSYGKGVLYETPCYIDYRTGEDVKAAETVNQRIAEVGWDDLTAEETDMLHLAELKEIMERSDKLC